MARSSKLSSREPAHGCDELTVVIVDDDDAFRNGLAEHLREDGHRVVEYSSPVELPALASLPTPTLLITDYQIPFEDGLSLAERFHAVHPRVPVLIVTAHFGEHLNAAVAARDFLSLHRKPLEYADFHKAVHRLAGS